MFFGLDRIGFVVSSTKREVVDVYIVIASVFGVDHKICGSGLERSVAEKTAEVSLGDGIASKGVLSKVGADIVIVVFEHDDVSVGVV